MRSDKAEILFATGNSHKFREAKAVLAKSGVRIRMLQTPKVEIQHTRLKAIAVFAAKSLSRRRDRVIMVEDSGLFVENLNGFPGPYSSFVFQTIGCEGILRLMQGNSNREANFKSVVATLLPNGDCKAFKGRVQGSISKRAAGTQGFGFDPIFVPSGRSATFAQIDEESKNKLSHRARALEHFVKWYVDWIDAGDTGLAEP